MSKQIGVRLPEDLVEFIDELVATGAERRRASVVSRALERERRRAIAARDAAILAVAGDDADMDGLAEYAVRVSPDLGSATDPHRSTRSVALGAGS